jgi:hypothetical protein
MESEKPLKTCLCTLLQQKIKSLSQESVHLSIDQSSHFFAEMKSMMQKRKVTKNKVLP